MSTNLLQLIVVEGGGGIVCEARGDYDDMMMIIRTSILSISVEAVAFCLC